MNKSAWVRHIVEVASYGNWIIRIVECEVACKSGR